MLQYFEGHSSLHLAAAMGKTDVVRLLLTLDANVEMKGSDGLSITISVLYRIWLNYFYF